MAGAGKLSSSAVEHGADLADGLVVVLRAMDTDDFWILLVILTAIAVGGFIWAFSALRRARVIEDTPTSKIRSAAQGYVELNGTQLAMDGAPVIAPLSKQQCTWWCFKIERLERSGKSSHWRTLHSGVSEACFFIDDGTGRCIIDPDDAEVIPSVDLTWQGSSEWPASAPDASSLIGFGSYRYSESRMHSGETLYALGFFHTRGDHMDIDMGTAMADRLRIWKQDQEALMQRFDTDGDGRIDEDEWDAARAAARAEIRDEYADRLAAGGIDVLAAPSDARPYLLSVLPQTGLARRYRIQGGVAIVAFFLFGAAAVFAITARFG